VPDVTSQQFLILYATGCVLLLVSALWLTRWRDASNWDGREPLPSDLDPYEIAFLRGDVNELVRFLVFDLVRTGALELCPAEGKKPQLFRRAPNAPAVPLTPPAQAVYDFFDAPHSAGELFKSSVPQRVSDAYAGEREKLMDRGLFTPPWARSAARQLRLVGVIAIVGLGAYRLWYAFTVHHRNVGYLITIGIVSLVLLFVFTSVPRLSRRGRQYLRTLRAGLPASPAPAATMSPAFGLVVAAGGMAVLAGTPYAGVSEEFKKQAASDGSSSSGGCGSGYGCSSGGGGSSDGGGSSCSGGGCGGGCGG
jgi:uncharacterized protein (TIGR04222 family)